MKTRLISVTIALGVTALAVVLILSALTGSIQQAAAGALQSDKPRIESPNISTADQELLIQGNSAFAFDLYQALRAKEGNLFYSPHSISLALAMTHVGARGESAEQMADTLRFLLDQENLHQAFNWLDAELAQRGEGGAGKDDGEFRLNVVNAIWGQKDYAFLSAFLDVLAENYGAGLRVLDFINETEPSRLAINRWVSEETEGRIQDLIPQGAISELTRLVLTNAIYFNAAWEHPFDEHVTSDAPFYLMDGSPVMVPRMSQMGLLGYARGPGYRAVDLPYDGGELSMVIILPDAGQFEAFESQMDARAVSSIIRTLRTTRIALTMPRFEFDSGFSLKDTLAAMGMPVAFTEYADFSGMTGDRVLSISDVVHKAVVAVDEAGIEAAAATAVIVGVTFASIEPPVQVTIDRPFIFLIRDIETGAILFLGRVVNPAA